MWDHGASYFNYKGLVWDGGGTAAVGVDHFSQDLFSTFMLHRLEAFLAIDGRSSHPRGAASYTLYGESLMECSKLRLKYSTAHGYT